MLLTRVRSSGNHSEDWESNEDEKEKLEMTRIFYPESSKKYDVSSCHMILPNLHDGDDFSSSEEQTKGRIIR